MLKKIRRFVSADYFERQYLFENFYARLFGILFYRQRFRYFGKGAILKRPSQIFGAKTIYIGDLARVEQGAILYSVQNYAGLSCGGEIKIGKGVYANRNLNISAGAPVIIGDHVTLASNVFISNYDHGYVDISYPINDQPLMVHGEIVIGQNSWLGSNVCVLGHVNIGSHVVIGANSVVTTDIPSYCVAVGSPARVVRRFDMQTQTWMRVRK